MPPNGGKLQAGSKSRILTSDEIYQAVYGVPGLTGDEYAAAYLGRASDKNGQFAYEDYGSDGLETYLGLRSVADLDENGSISKKELVATLEAAGLTQAQKAYYFDLLKSGDTKNPYQ